MSEQLSLKQLTGQDEGHLCDVAGEQAKLHPRAAQAYVRMRSAAEAAGLSMAIASGFRSLERQLFIWNRKWRGETTVRDKQGAPLNVNELDETSLLKAVLHWSALPGTSRHHWGTDFDVYDPEPFRDGTQTLQLIPSEYCDESGPCYTLWRWLADNAHEYGFFFPYARYQGGVAQEPWHLSYRPLAATLQQQLTLPILAELITSIAVEGRATISEHLPLIHKQYINNLCEDNGWTNIWCGYSSF